MEKKIILPEGEMWHYVLGVHKQTQQPKVFGRFKTPEAAENKFKELTKINDDFIVSVNNLNLEHQVPTAKELGITDYRVYNEYNAKEAEKIRPIIDEFINKNMPESFDYIFYLETGSDY